ncbi:hypothetical protein [Antarcticimicrobium luteum]|uniref:Uncharacterized protein n=1 Tax=Antarcticimicrobium luteum TaxID=2547397 RepID=A0A4R5V9W5_9RHOB|nr:hypothetical protein [Antarcticimicrobium luteum]TDK48942.1 hypothetical protein E1832_09115 [Antarcticimicrobium luteum]
MFENVSLWVSKHQTLITLVVLPIVFFVLTHWIANRTDKRAAVDRVAQRKLSKQIKLAEFDVDRLKELRRDLTDYINSLRSWRLTDVPSHQIVTGRYHKVLLQLDRENESYERFVKVSDYLLEAPDFPIFNEEYEPLKSLAVDILNDGKANTYSALVKVDEPQ